MKHTKIWIAGLMALVLAACAGRVPPGDIEEQLEPEEPALVPVNSVDLDRYMGRWYLIANIPYFMERGNLDPYVEYSRRDDGLINDFLFAQDAFDEPHKKKEGLIEITSPITNAEGRVTFLRPIWQDFTVVFLDEDYLHTAIGHPSRNYAWIFAREPYVEDEIYQKMLGSLKANGFDATRLMKFPRTPSEQGLPGYQ